MKGLAEVVLSLCNLLEAEGRLFQKNALDTVRIGCLLMAGFFFAIVALVFLVGALYVILCAILPKAGVLAIMGAVCALVSLGLFWSGRICRKRKKTSPRLEKKSVA